VWIDVVTAIDDRSPDSFSRDDREVLDAYLLTLRPGYEETEFESLGEHWRQIDGSLAAKLITLLATTSLCHPLPHTKDWIGPVAPSTFAAAFSAGARWYTNALNPEGASTASEISSWTATNATRDIGVGAIDDRIVGFVWAQEED
jgi:hypothetical protein